MRLLLRKPLALTVVLALLSGCASTGTSPGSSSSSTSNDETRTKAEGTALGALLGAAIGAGIGAAVGGKKGAAIGAGAGAVLGGAGGYMLGSTVAERKKRYVSEEAGLKGEIEATGTYNAELRDYNSKTRIQIAALDQQTLDLNARYRAGKVRAGDLQKKQDEINMRIKEGEERKNAMNSEMIALKEYTQTLKQSQPQANVAKLEQEVATLQENIAMLDSNNQQLAQMSKSLTVRK